MRARFLLVISLVTVLAGAQEVTRADGPAVVTLTCTLKGAMHFLPYSFPHDNTVFVQAEAGGGGSCVRIDATDPTAVKKQVRTTTFYLGILYQITGATGPAPLPQCAAGHSLEGWLDLNFGPDYVPFDAATLVDYPGVQGQNLISIAQGIYPGALTGVADLSDRIFGMCPSSTSPDGSWTDNVRLTLTAAA